MKAQFANVGRGKGTMTLREPFRTKPLEQVLAEPEIGAMRLKQALGPWDIVTAAAIVFLAYGALTRFPPLRRRQNPPEGHAGGDSRLSGRGHRALHGRGRHHDRRCALHEAEPRRPGGPGA